MKIPWPRNQCIFCLMEGSLSEEHLILKSLGGILTSEFVCSSCNSQLGHAVEATVKSDPWVILAAENLSQAIPRLSKRLVGNQPLIGYGGLGPLSGYIRDKEFCVKSQILNDGSLIQPEGDARRSIAKILQRCGYGEESIRIALAKHDRAQEGKRVKLASGLEVVKGSIQKIEPDMSKWRLMDKLVPVKIAFEFLALHLGTAIYDDVSQLHEVRRALLTRTLKVDVVRVERLFSNEDGSLFHGICFEGNNLYARVQIRFFGRLAFRVHFLHLHVGGPLFAYTHKLDTGEEVLTQLNKTRDAA